MLLPLLSAFQLAAAQLPSPAGVHDGQLGQTSVALPRIDTTVVVDGRLDEPVWSRAAILKGFSLYAPADGRPAPDSTEVLVWYSPDAMYFGIRAYADPATVAATLADRDRISSDDNVEIHLDTFHERNRAFVFIVNPLGIQADGTKSEGGGFIPGSNVGPGQNDLSADFRWDSRGRVTAWGYEVEVRIPFATLRYPASMPQTWGLQIDRHVQRNGYEETWTPARKASASFIAQSGTLTGLMEMIHGQTVELNPELTNTTFGAPCCSPSFDRWTYSSNPQLGGNVRWAMGSN
ncbi:MAG TPA: carbohydrate binding family 9 domain-containing protein, partial [Gemmatimonadaceae bacterium]|nr:carbohydrate binding family 9 domain-containing protein [Gemmatimonadaceae bacterium]